MIELYFYPAGIRILLCVVGFVCVSLQTAAVVYGFDRIRKNVILRWAEIFLEILILLQVLMMSWFCALIFKNAHGGYALLPEYFLLRYVLFALLTGAVIFVSLERKLIYPLGLIVVTAITLPIFEKIFDTAFVVLFAVAFLYYMLRSIHMILLTKRKIKTELSANSIKFAIDALHSGVLFSEKGGQIMLINRQMKNLMMILAGKVYRNANDFYEICLVRGECGADSEKLDAEEEIIYKLPDETVWMFTKESLNIDQQHYLQLSASDVTERWKMIARLKEQNSRLQEQSEQLKEALINIQSICYEEESSRIKSRFHDVLGYRIALLLRSLREDTMPDEAMLLDLTDDFLTQLRKNEPKLNAKVRIDAIGKTMQNMGVAFQVEGKLPRNEEMATLCADVIMEASTNAVRHGLAEEISVQMQQGAEGFLLRIVNSGLAPRKEITEGSGIMQMRRKIEERGGTFYIVIKPKFELNIYIPRGEKYG